MSCVKIYDNNYCDPDFYANLLTSSEQTNFPSTNALARIRRSKVWRSQGYFLVDSTNNGIVFRDDVSTNITASIAVGEYTSIASFMAAVDAALEAVGASNYTVTQTAFYRFTIASNLSGGATAFQLRTTHASFTAASLLGFDTATDRTGATSYTADFLRINSEEWITFDLGVPANPTDVVLIGRRNQPIKLSTTATIKIQGNTTNNWVSPEFTETLTYNDEAIITADETGLHTTNLRYWRVSFEDQNPNGYLEIGAMFIGETYEPDRGAVVFPFNSNLSDLSSNSRSEGGQTFSDISEKTQFFNVEWNALTTTEMERLKLIFDTFGTSHPFFISFDTPAAFSSNANRMTKYIKFADEPSYSLISPNNFNFNMKFREEL